MHKLGGLIFYTQMIFDKPHLSVDEQIELLIQRKLIIENKDTAFKFLTNISYYRLSAYAYHFRENINGSYIFAEGTTFEKVLKLYFFDRELRMLIFDMIERIEISFRTQISYHYSLNNPWWFEQIDNFQKKRLFVNDLNKIYAEIDRSKEPFIKEYKRRYTSPELPPSWMTMEVFSMGLLSKIYSNLTASRIKNDIAKHFKIHRPDTFESWMHCLTHVRNICAHHCRVWDRTLTVSPKFPRITANQWLVNTTVEPTKLYAFLSCALYLLKVINPNTHFVNKFNELAAEGEVNLQIMGFPENWREEPLWQPNLH